MKSIKEWNWKQIGWRVLQALVLFVINGAAFACLVMNMIDLGEAQNIGGRTISIDYWLALPLKFKILVWVLIIGGAIASFFFIKFLYKNRNEKKKVEHEDKMIEKLMRKSNE